MKSFVTPSVVIDANVIVYALWRGEHTDTANAR